MNLGSEICHQERNYNQTISYALTINMMNMLEVWELDHNSFLTLSFGSKPNSVLAIQTVLYRE